LSPAKTDEPIEMPFAMFSRVDRRNHYQIECRCPSRKGHF